MVDLKDLGKAIRSLRGNRSQKVCAERVGLSASAWSLYEHGKRNSRPAMRERLARGLEVELQVLEEKAWQIRNERLASASPEESVPRAGGGADDPVLHAVYEHLKGVNHHLQEAMLILYLRASQKPPLTP